MGKKTINVLLLLFGVKPLSPFSSEMKLYCQCLDCDIYLEWSYVKA